MLALAGLESPYTRWRLVDYNFLYTVDRPDTGRG